MVELTREDRALKASIDLMEASRLVAASEGDLVKLAEIDGWFRQHAPVIRRLRDKLEADEFDNP